MKRSGIINAKLAGATAAEEVERNPRPHELLTANLPGLGFIPHEELKRMVAGAKLVVRTGEASPYSNVILRCGVPFYGASQGFRHQG